MSAPPFMPLYVGDYLADTTHLTALEHGVYMLLLMSMWRTGGSLPNDDAKLARFARCSPTNWAKCKPAVLEFFTIENGAIHQCRLSAELQKYGDVVHQKRKAGRASADARALKNNTPASTPVEHTFNELEPEPEREDISEANASSPRATEPLPFAEPLPPTPVAAAPPKTNDFARFWEPWPKKVQRRTAELAFARAVKRAGGLAPILAGIDAAKRSSRQWREGFIPNPATWLNADGWLDDHGSPALSVVARSPSPLAAADPDRLQDFRLYGTWKAAWGPAPSLAAATMGANQ